MCSEQPQLLQATCISALLSHEPVDLEAGKTDAVFDVEGEVLSLMEKSRAGGKSTDSVTLPKSVCMP